MLKIFKLLILAVSLSLFYFDEAGVAADDITKVSDVKDAKAEIRAAMQNWLTAYNNRKIDDLIGLYSEKIYYANNGSALQRNVDDIRRNYEQRFQSDIKTTINFSEELVNVSGDTGYIAGKYQVIINANDGGARYAYGRVLLIFERKEGDRGKIHDWKLVVDFDNIGSDISSADFKAD